MSPSSPFHTAGGELDTDAILVEAVPLAKLVALVGLVALVPVAIQLFLVELLGLVPFLSGLLSIVTQFVLAVGSGLVLLYVVVRAIRLAEE